MTNNSNDRSRSSSSRTKSASGSPHASTPAGGVGSPSAHKPTNLYVGGLHDSVRDQELEHRFSVFGRIESAKVMLHIHTGRSRGIGFVKFADHESAVAAIRGLHRTLLAGQRIMVRFADTRADYRPGDKTDKVFVRNLPFDITHNQLRSHFERFGTVLDLTMHLDTAGFKAGGMGARTRMAYVRMSTVDEAEAAATQVHGTKPFPSCTALVMAKLAESEHKRLERRAHKGSPATEPPSNPSDTASSMHAAPDAQSNATPISEPSRVESHQSGRVAAVPPSISSGVQTSSNPQTSSGSGSDKEKRESSESDDVNSNDNASGSGGTAAAPVRAVGIKSHSHQQLGASATDATPLTPVVPTIPAVRVGGAVRPPTAIAGAASANTSAAATSTKPSSAPPAPFQVPSGVPPAAGAPLLGMLPAGAASGPYNPYPNLAATGALGAFNPGAFAAAAGAMPFTGGMGYPTSAMFAYPAAGFPPLPATPYGSAAGFPSPYPSASSMYSGFPAGFAGLPTGYGGGAVPLSAASLASAAAAAPGLPYRFSGGVGPTGVSPPPGSLPLASPAVPPAGFAPWLAGVPGLLPS